MAEKTNGFSKTAFVLFIFLIAFIFIMTPIVGVIAGKVIGEMAIGWVIGGILTVVLMIMLDSTDYKLNDDFKWKYSNNLDDINKKLEELANLTKSEKLTL